MVRPKNLKTKIFLDSGDPGETKEALKILGLLNGQTTNPSLVAKHPEVVARLAQGKKFTKEEVYDFYRDIVAEISHLIPEGSVSIEVYADRETTAETMLDEGKKMFSWIPNAHIKFPTTKTGLIAAQKALEAGIRVNMTLCFTQEQASAVDTIAQSVPHPDIFISPFVGRLDDCGENGMDLVANICQMYRRFKSPVKVLVASVRNLNHLLYALSLGVDITTAPLSILSEWAKQGKPQSKQFIYDAHELSHIPYKEINQNFPLEQHSFNHPLLATGLQKFADDWNKLIK